MASQVGRAVAGIAADADAMTEAVVHFETRAWSALLEWLEFHGIDPKQIPAGTRVSRDACGRCIRYVRIVSRVLDERGHLEDPGGYHPGGLWVTVPAVEQGEAAPLPYPPEVTELLRPVLR